MIVDSREFYNGLEKIHDSYRNAEYELASMRIEDLMRLQVSRLAWHGTLYACAGMVATRLGSYHDARGLFRKAVDNRYSEASARIIGHIGLIMYWAPKDNEYSVNMSMREIEVLMNNYTADYWLLEAMGELVLDMARLKRFDDAKKYYGLTLGAYDHFHAEFADLDDPSCYDPEKVSRMRADIDYCFAVRVLMEIGEYENAVKVISYGPLVRYAQLGMKKEYAECFRQLSLAYLMEGKAEQALLAEKNCWYQLPVDSEESYASCARIHKIALDAWKNPISQLDEMFSRSVEPVDREKYFLAIDKKMKEL